MTEVPVKSTGRKKKYIAIFAFLLLLLILFILYMLGFFHKPEPDGPLLSGGNYKKGELPGASSESVNKGNVGLTINGKPIFENGSSEGSLLISNPPYNIYDMTVSIHMGADGSGELLYQTDIITPNHYIDYDKLLINLEQGEYPSIATFTYYDEEQTELNKAQVAITIIIKN